jgi:hypothetical protein
LQRVSPMLQRVPSALRKSTQSSEQSRKIF